MPMVSAKAMEAVDRGRYRNRTAGGEGRIKKEFEYNVCMYALVETIQLQLVRTCPRGRLNPYF